ncbi:MAG: arginine deiminase-related protein [Flavobacteriaceae bacterium]|nr:arginine deiminase-related protein [Flavobacteriaceae bacterium]
MKRQQITNTILMIRPVNFRMNEQTAVNNFYQKELQNLSSVEIQKKALNEFNTFVEKLQAIGVHVIIIDDTKLSDTPDSIFPNNWISFHQNGTVALYPMFAENRRNERREDILDQLEEKGFEIKNIVDYTSAEKENIFLEGTGSLLLDRVNKKAYCALSPRANEELFIEFCEDFEYTPVLFHAYQTVDNQRKLIYHTNVMMTLTEKYAIICLDTIDNKKERKNIINHIKESGKEIISITEKQVNKFAGNMLQVIGVNKDRYIIMSEVAYRSLDKNQIEKIEKESIVLYSNLETIEVCGGGSARCMMTDVFLPY